MPKIICVCDKAADLCFLTCPKGLLLKPTLCYNVPQWPRKFGTLGKKAMMEKLNDMNKS